MSPLPRTVVVLAVLGLAACEDFATPSDLDRPQIIAVVADPPSIDPGDRAELTAIVAGPDGPIADARVAWTVRGLPGELPQGVVEREVDGPRSWYVAPAEVAERPTAAPLEGLVTVGDVELRVSKLVGIGAPGLSNPTIAGITVDGHLATTLAVGATTTLEVSIDDASDDASVSWYSTAGEIERYRSNPTELVVDDEVGPAWVIAVVRDRGGQAVYAIETAVE